MIATNTKKIILYLLKNLELVNINQIARLLKISVGSAFKILKELEKNDIVSTTRLGNATYYKLNIKNNETASLCSLLLLEEKRLLKGYPKVYADDIKDFKDAELIVLFGSVLKGKDFNDVDVLFVTAKPKAVTKFCLEISKVRAKPVVPLVMKKEDLVAAMKNKKIALVDIVRTGVILKGESVFLEVICDAQSQV